MKTILTSILLLLASFAGFAQDHEEHAGLKDWPELNNFHTIISQTFHPSEEGNLDPLKKQSGELLKRAKTLSVSKVPAAFNNAKVKAAVAKLLAETQKTDAAVKSKQPDEQLKAQIARVHDAFHGIVGLCSKNEG